MQYREIQANNSQKLHSKQDTIWVYEYIKKPWTHEISFDTKLNLIKTKVYIPVYCNITNIHILWNGDLWSINEGSYRKIAHNRRHDDNTYV